MGEQVSNCVPGEQGYKKIRLTMGNSSGCEHGTKKENKTMILSIRLEQPDCITGLSTW